MANLPCCQAQVANLWGHLIISGLFCRSSPSTPGEWSCHVMALFHRRWQRHATCLRRWAARSSQWFHEVGTSEPNSSLQMVGNHHEHSWTIYHHLSISPTNCNTLHLEQIRVKRLHHLKERQIKFKRNNTSDIRRLFLGLRVSLCCCTAKKDLDFEHGILGFVSQVVYWSGRALKFASHLDWILSVVRAFIQICWCLNSAAMGTAQIDKTNAGPCGT